MIVRRRSDVSSPLALAVRAWRTFAEAYVRLSHWALAGRPRKKPTALDVMSHWPARTIGFPAWHDRGGFRGEEASIEGNRGDKHRPRMIAAVAWPCCIAAKRQQRRCGTPRASFSCLLEPTDARNLPAIGRQSRLESKESRLTGSP